MSGSVLLSPRQRAQIERLRAGLFATRLAVADPAVSIVFTRPDGSTTAAQRVLVRIAGGGGATGSTIGGATDFIDGTVEAVEPFDVATGYRFAFPSGEKGEIATVNPPQNGRRTAAFLLDAGGRARFLAGGF